MQSITSRKDKTTAVILCLFLGHLGAHRFYVGKIGTGILWVFTCGLFGIGSLVDLCCLLFNRFRDSEGMVLRGKKRPEAQTTVIKSNPVFDVSKPIKHKSTTNSAESIISPSDEFFVNNCAYLQSLEHQVVTPKMKDYGDIDSYRLAYEISLKALYTLKDFCYSSPEGREWYSEMYLHCFNSQNSDFSLEEQIEDGYRDLMENWVEYKQRFQARKDATDFLIEKGPYIRRRIIDIVKSYPGILQKDIYSEFDPTYKESVIKIILTLNKEKVLFREPYKNTFQLFLTPSVLRNDSESPKPLNIEEAHLVVRD